MKEAIRSMGPGIQGPFDAPRRNPRDWGIGNDVHRLPRERLPGKGIHRRQGMLGGSLGARRTGLA